MTDNITSLSDFASERRRDDSRRGHPSQYLSEVTVDEALQILVGHREWAARHGATVDRARLRRMLARLIVIHAQNGTSVPAATLGLMQEAALLQELTPREEREVVRSLDDAVAVAQRRWEEAIARVGDVIGPLMVGARLNVLRAR